MLSVQHLRVVRALATHAHFGRAAETLGISQPALSKSLNHIEALLGVKLFERKPQLRPTAFGDIVLAHSASIVSDFSEMLREMSLVEGLEVGSIKISAGLYPAELSVQQAIGVLSRNHPKLICSLVIKDWVEVGDDVLARKCDLGIADITAASRHPDLQTEALRESPFTLFCRAGHPLTDSPNVTFEDILEYPWTGPSLPGRMRTFLPREPKPFGVFDATTDRVLPRLMVETVAAAKNIAIASDAVSAAPRPLIAREIADGRIEALALELPWLKLNYGFIWLDSRALSVTSIGFMKVVREVEAQLGS